MRDTFRYGGGHLLHFPFFQHFLLLYNTPLLSRVRQHNDTADTFTNTRTIGVFGFLTGRSVFNLRRLRLRLDDLYMGTARTGYTSKALWVFDFSLILAGFTTPRAGGMENQWQRFSCRT